MSKPIPELRHQLMLLATHKDMPEQFRAQLRSITGHMWRKPAIKRAPPTANHMTSKLAAAIREWAKNHMNETNREIASRFGVDAGRVSEVLHGDRWQ